MNATPELSRRETEILESLSAGASNTEISRVLNISVNTVKYHLKRIYRKLNTRNRVDAARRFRQLHIDDKP